MQHFLYTLLIALTNNIDNLGARITYSMSGIRISLLVNLWITVITFVISFLAAISGTMITGSLGNQFASVIAMVMLVAIGS
jgi:putative Mn2+ efflux pump MntP